MINKTIYNNEEVFVVSLDKTSNIKDGFNRGYNHNIWKIYNDIGKYIPRDIVEGDAAFQQIVPYILIRNTNGKFLITKAEKTKNNNCTISMGICNHIIPCDGVYQPLFHAATRILFKAVDFNKLLPMEYVGTVRDMSSKMNDHIGYVFIISNVDEEQINLLSIKNTGEWVSKEELIEKYHKCETWTKHIINFLVDNDFY